jgi:hypothetical protein
MGPDRQDDGSLALRAVACAEHLLPRQSSPPASRSLTNMRTDPSPDRSPDDGRTCT